MCDVCVCLICQIDKLNKVFFFVLMNVFLTKKKKRWNFSVIESKWLTQMSWFDGFFRWNIHDDSFRKKTQINKTKFNMEHVFYRWNFFWFFDFWFMNPQFRMFDYNNIRCKVIWRIYTPPPTHTIFNFELKKNRMKIKINKWWVRLFHRFFSFLFGCLFLSMGRSVCWLVSAAAIPKYHTHTHILSMKQTTSSTS